MLNFLPIVIENLQKMQESIQNLQVELLISKYYEKYLEQTLLETNDLPEIDLRRDFLKDYGDRIRKDLNELEEKWKKLNSTDNRIFGRSDK